MEMKTTRVAIVALLAVLVFIYFVYRHADDRHVISLGKQPIKLQTYETNNINTYCTNVSFRNIYSYNSSKWDINKDVCNGCFRLVKTRMKTQFGETPIYVYEPKNDVFVSNHIINEGSFDGDKINQLLDIFKTDPTLNFIDIGANLGVFSLSVAKMGRKVLAIEALNSNVQHLCFSIKDGGFGNNLTVIHNALSDKSGIEVDLGVDKNNMGGTFIDFDAQHTKDLKKSHALKIGGSYGRIQTFTLDNLLESELIKDFKNVAIKMDIEGFEHRALLGALKFFDATKIRLVYMEWVFHKGRPSGKVIIDFMTKRNFKPYSEDGKHILDLSKSTTWPWNVLWLPK